MVLRERFDVKRLRFVSELQPLIPIYGGRVAAGFRFGTVTGTNIAFRAGLLIETRSLPLTALNRIIFAFFRDLVDQLTRGLNLPFGQELSGVDLFLVRRR